MPADKPRSTRQARDQHKLNVLADHCAVAGRDPQAISWPMTRTGW
jgi:hypothetical protein